MKKPLKYWSLFFLLASLEGGFALFVLLRIPSDLANSIILGLSAARFGMVAALFGMVIALVWLGALAWRKPLWREKYLDPANFPKASAALTRLSALAALLTASGLFLLRYYDPERLMPVFLRAQPLLLYIAVLTFQLTLWLLLLRYGFHLQAFRERMGIYRNAGIALIVLLLLMGIVTITRIGLIPDSAYWAETGVALQGWQVGLAILAGLFTLLLSLQKPVDQDKRIDILFAVLLWGIAVGSWLSVPLDVLENSFYAPYAYPLGQSLPYSDAGFYDYLSQGLLLGNGFLAKIPPRPLYIVFLAGLHALFGVRYDLIIMGQTLVLAFFPVVLYLLGKKLHSRAAGVTVALLAIFRELTSILISSNTRVSNSKMMLTDVPTALILSLVVLLVIQWLERKDRQPLGALVAGGGFGLLLLLRTQSMLILPFIFLIALLVFLPHWKQWVMAILIFMLGVTVSVGPWLLHNARLTGKLTFDDPQQLALLSSQYSFDENLNLDAFDHETESLSNNLAEFAIKNPGFVAGFISNHFMATEIGGLMALPLLEPFNGLRAPINLYWVNWDGHLTASNLLLMIFYLALIAVGLGAAWHRLRWLGLMPLVFNLGYALANGLARFSGWRYDLPVDWIAYFYFGIGVVELLLGIALLFGADTARPKTRVKKDSSLLPKSLWTRAAFIIAGFILVGFSPSIMETSIPPHFENLSRDALITQMAGLKNNALDVQSFAAEPDAVIFSGRLLFPRFYRSGAGLASANPWPSYEARDISRMGFLLINKNARHVILPMKKMPAEFPNAVDVIVLGCQRDGYVEAWMLGFVDAGETVVSEAALTDCSQ
ncbi:MAG: hypothetical protein B6I38_07915 [Anaerolineaceae bacterium 4572_5.1]|nr:MAG: hypothetical protein B6I38_07915 [Anaerolineaceae bacterium 4572_5.1]